MKASFRYTPLQFKQPVGTSRGILTTKHSWILEIEEDDIVGTGEFSVIPGLSPDFESIEQYQREIENILININDISQLIKNLKEKPSLLFGLESALLDLKNGGKKKYFDNYFSKGKKKIAINGLIWMGEEKFMQQQIEQKLQEGFTTIKMKIGAIDFKTEYKLLQNIRKNFDEKTITIRVDANGAFQYQQAKTILEQLASLQIHSIEQPIKAGNLLQMKQLCKETPTPIALDEELIGIYQTEDKIKLLKTIQPQYIILKPSLHGGISGTKEWIEIAEQQDIKWWITSALESNIGLKTICDFAGEYNNPLPQGLGTGSLYKNNFTSNLAIENGEIFIKN